MNANDLDALTEILRYAEQHEDDDYQLVTDNTRQAFQRMREELEGGHRSALSDKQRSWVQGVLEKVTGTPTYENAWSAGRVPMGKPVATPEVLKRLPKRPPQRRSEGS